MKRDQLVFAQKQYLILRGLRGETSRASENGLSHIVNPGKHDEKYRLIA
jgi:hypothetical protein